jgi:hypothetical protein
MHTFVNRIVTDKWSGLLCDEDEIHAPTVDDLDRVIEELDAKTHTLVSLYGESGAYLSIGGGAGQYVAYASTSDEQLWNLLSDSDDRNGIVLLNAGGQEGDFPARQVVDKVLALQAARVFFGTGKLDFALRWEKQTY